jgi:hypothetical protein
MLVTRHDLLDGHLKADLVHGVPQLRWDVQDDGPLRAYGATEAGKDWNTSWARILSTEVTVVS